METCCSANCKPVIWDRPRTPAPLSPRFRHITVKTSKLDPRNHLPPIKTKDLRARECPKSDTLHGFRPQTRLRSPGKDLVFIFQIRPTAFPGRIRAFEKCSKIHQLHHQLFPLGGEGSELPAQILGKGRQPGVSAAET